MSLKVKSETDEQRQLKLTIEVPETRVEKAMRQKARQLSREVSIPGFRRGKVPFSVLIRRLGRDVVRTEAIDDLVQPIFVEAVEEIEEDIYGQPSLEDMQLEPLVLEFLLPLTPEIKLGDYRSLRQELDPVEVTEEALAEHLEHIRIQHQVIEAVDRPAEKGDVVTVSGKGVVVRRPEKEEEPEEADAEDEESEPGRDVILDEERIDLLMDNDKLFPGTPFVDNLLSLKVGDEKSFTMTFPSDFDDEDLAGVDAKFDLSILDVKRRELPELNDDLAKEHGKYETLEELKEASQKDLLKQAEAQAQNERIEGLVDTLLEDTEMVYPPAAVESEIDSLVSNFKGQVERSGWSWEDYLKLQGNSEASIRENFKETAVTQLERRLVLQQFIVNEKITVDADDVDASIEERVGQYDNDELKESIGNYFRSGYGFEMVSSEILMTKVDERIRAIYSGNAPDLAELDTAVSDAATDEEE